jgi:hypothetical protein
LTRFTVWPLFPKVLTRGNRGELFTRAIRNKYGARASRVVRSYTPHRVRILRNARLVELNVRSVRGET